MLRYISQVVHKENALTQVWRFRKKRNKQFILCSFFLFGFHNIELQLKAKIFPTRIQLNIYKIRYDNNLWKYSQKPNRILKLSHFTIPLSMTDFYKLAEEVLLIIQYRGIQLMFNNKCTIPPEERSVWRNQAIFLQPETMFSHNLFYIKFHRRSPNYTNATLFLTIPLKYFYR